MDEQSYETYLKFSDADLAANRDGVIRGDQRAWMVWSGVWRLIVGPAVAIAGSMVTFASDNALVMTLGLGILGVGLYLTWRGFAFFTDSIVARVAYVTGQLHTRLVQGKNYTAYYASVGPASKRISSRAYNALRSGGTVHLYYAPACRSLLSVEPANVDEPRPGHPFGPDSAHAWNRLRLSWVAITVGGLGLLLGAHAATLAQPVHLTSVESTVSDYTEHHGKTTTRKMYLGNDPDSYNPQAETSYDPTAPDFYSLIGSPVVIYTDTGSRDILAFKIEGVLYSTDWYLHPEHKVVFEAANAAVVFVVSLLLILAGILGVRRARSAHAEASGRYEGLFAPPSVHRPIAVLPAAMFAVGAAMLVVLWLVILSHT